MGREVRRVPLDFDWPLKMVWSAEVRRHGRELRALDREGRSARTPMHPTRGQQRPGSTTTLAVIDYVTRKGRVSIRGVAAWRGWADSYARAWLESAREAGALALEVGSSDVYVPAPGPRCSGPDQSGGAE